MMRIPSVSVEEYIDQDWCFEDGGDWNAVEISSVIRKWARPGNWLDLGCGPMLSVWPMFAVNESSIWGCDRQIAVSQFHSELKLRAVEAWPTGLLRAVEFYNRKFSRVDGRKHITTPVARIRELVTSSILQEQTQWRSHFDTIVQIGCFGCLDSINDLKAAIDLVYVYLKHGGKFISATWLPRRGYEESEVWGGVRLSTLSCDEFVSLIRAASMKVIEVRLAKVNDPIHDTRYVIVAEKL